LSGELFWWLLDGGLPSRWESDEAQLDIKLVVISRVLIYTKSQIFFTISQSKFHNFLKVFIFMSQNLLFRVL